MKMAYVWSTALALLLVSCSATEPTTVLHRSPGDGPLRSDSDGSENRVARTNSEQTVTGQQGGTTVGTAAHATGMKTNSTQTGGTVVGSAGTVGAAVDAAFEAVAGKCASCHSGKSAPKNFTLSSTDPQDWINKSEEIIREVSSGSMPPPPNAFSDAEKAAFLKLLEAL